MTLPYVQHPSNTILDNKTYPRIEQIISSTVLEQKFSSFNIGELFDFESFKKQIGTTLIIDNPFNNELSEIVEEQNNFFSDNYDIIVKLPIRKSFSVKGKISSIQKFTPKISI